jgi:hypothetical protein
MRDTLFIQKYSLLAMYIAVPIFLLANRFHHAWPPFLVVGCAVLLIISLCSMAATLFSGIAFGTGFQPYERKSRPGAFWLIIVAQTFVCFVCVFAIIQGIHRWNDRKWSNHSLEPIAGRREVHI